MSIALTYEILGNEDLTPVLMVVIVRTVVMPNATRADVALDLGFDNDYNHCIEW